MKKKIVFLAIYLMVIVIVGNNLVLIRNIIIKILPKSMYFLLKTNLFSNFVCLLKLVNET